MNANTNTETPETWTIIPFANQYECSDKGNIRNIKTQKKLSLVTNLGGYSCVRITTNNKKPQTFLVHRIVAIVFLENPKNKKTVDHIDRIKNNNNLDNLRWATDNEQSKNRKKKTYVQVKKIWQCDKVTKEKIKLFNTPKEAAIYIGKPGREPTITSCACGDKTSAFGFFWIYDTTDLNKYENEEWKLYKKTTHKEYYVSNFGRIRNKENVFNPSPHNGYYNVTINKKTKAIHIIVAELFVENPKPGEYNIVNHIDANKLNNKAENLEWVNQQINMQHAADLNLNGMQKRVVHYNDDNTIIKVYENPTKVKEELKIGKKSIYDCCLGRTNICRKGKTAYRFKYFDEKTDDLVQMKIITDVQTNLNLNGAQKKKVVHYDDDDNIIKIYASSEDASKELTITQTSIMKCCSGCIKFCIKNKLEYKFKYFDETTDDIRQMKVIKNIQKYIPPNKVHKRKIICYDNDNNILKIYKDCKDANKDLQIDTRAIYSCCKGHTKYCRKNNSSYRFKYFDENTDNLQQMKIIP
jgi:hypothetical protein